MYTFHLCISNEIFYYTNLWNFSILLQVRNLYRAVDLT